MIRRIKQSDQPATHRWQIERIKTASHIPPGEWYFVYPPDRLQPPDICDRVSSLVMTRREILNGLADNMLFLRGIELCGDEFKRMKRELAAALELEGAAA